MVAASWRRCLQAGLSPAGINVSEVQKAEKLNRLLENNSFLLEASRQSLDILAKSLAPLPFVILLCDPGGDIVFTTGSKPLFDLFLQTGAVGSNCRESVIGTTAPAIVLAEKKPAVVVLEEHFSKIYHWCCCAAAPIFDSKGALRACLNVMTSREHVSRINLLTGLSLTTSRAIECELRLREHLLMAGEMRGVAGAVLDCLQEPILIADREGTIQHANPMAGRLANMSCDLLRGMRCRDVIESEAIRTCLDKERKSTGRGGFVAHNSPKTCISVRAEALHNGQTEFVGAVIILEEEKKKWRAGLREAHPAPFTFGNVTGDSAAIRKALRLATIFAGSDIAILLHGETGTGKELFAQAIHNLSPRRNKPFVPVNCSAIPDALVESELFGYRKGAFTGAAREGKKGKFELADGGTLFLDEINSMDLELQAKLLRAVDTGEIVELGGHSYRYANARIIASINDPLEGATPPRGIRKDLFYRIASARIHLPPLRERLEDIEKLSIFFMKSCCEKIGKSLRGIETGALCLLRRHPWPGNIRELKSCMEFAVHVTEGDVIGAEHLPDYLMAGEEKSVVKPASPAQAIEAAEKSALQQVLAESKGRLGEAATRLGVSRSTFYRKCRKHGLNPV
ncbi:MAG: sigma 54-interacting transcriptional regulator [Syntrophobacteraceae bacterium]|nr:sigma 54-interacting transcriptional regulator [Syntrophobacteraceae bacterium]